MIEEKVLSFIHKHHLLEKDKMVAVGVSGGPDSLALLHFLWRFQRKWNLKITVLSLNHQLRGEDSHNDLVYVESICEKWNIPLVKASVDVPSYKENTHISTEVAARNVRYHFFAEQMEKFQMDYLALGHHGDDQIETMLMKLTRTAESSAFTGIPVSRPFSTGKIIRPFLCLSRAEIEQYCQEYGLEPRVDQTNFDDTYTRNYYRIHVTPLLREKNSNIHRTVQHLSETLHEDEIFLQEMAREFVKKVVHFEERNRSVSFSKKVFEKGPKTLQRRAFHLILNYLYKGVLPKKLSYIHEEQFFSLIKSETGNTSIDFPNNLRITRSYHMLLFHFTHPNSKHSSIEIPLHIPGKVNLPDGSIITAEFVDQMDKQDSYTFYCHIDDVSLPLHIRTRKAGDRMTWDGLKGTKKLKDIFIDEKIPIQQRDKWPIIVDEKDTILWLIGLKKGKYKETKHKGPYICLTVKKETSFPE